MVNIPSLWYYVGVPARNKLSIYLEKLSASIRKFPIVNVYAGGVLRLACWAENIAEFVTFYTLSVQSRGIF